MANDKNKAKSVPSRVAARTTPLRAAMGQQLLQAATRKTPIKPRKSLAHVPASKQQPTTEHSTPVISQLAKALLKPVITGVPEAKELSDAEKKRRAALPALGRASTTWKRGMPSPNPSGKPSSKPVIAAIKEALKENPEVLRDIVQVALAAASIGHLGYFKEIRDMLDGRPTVNISGPDGGPVELDVGDSLGKLFAELDKED